jgi:hypothetical protein
VPDESLEEGVVLRIHGQDHGSTVLAGLAEKVSGQDQGLLVGQADHFAGLGRGQRGHQPRRADLGRQDQIRLGQGGQGHVAVLADENLRIVSGRQEPPQFAGLVFGQDAEAFRAKSFGLPGQKRHVAGSGQGHDLEHIPILGHDLERAGADGAGAAQNGESTPARTVKNRR